MFNAMTYSDLQAYWWIIVSLLASLLVFLMFVQGGQTLLGQIAKNKMEHTLLVNSIGRKWDLTFTTLVTFGGAFFASFPLFYSTSFGGAYWVWMLILLSFVIQAVSYEYRRKADNFLGTKTYDAFLLINGILGTILIGAAVGTFFTGSEFSVNRLNITQIGSPTISRWENSTHGLEAALNIVNLSLGLSVFFLARVLGLLYFINNVNHQEIIDRSSKALRFNAVAFLVFFLGFLGLLFTREGFAVDDAGKAIVMEPYKYLHNLIQMPLVLILFLIGVLGALYGIFLGMSKKSGKGIWFAGSGTVITVFSILMLAGLNDTSFYPSTFDVQSSLTIHNASSSKYTLTAMSWVSLIVPVVVVYIWYTWRSMNRKKVSEGDLENDTMAY